MNFFLSSITITFNPNLPLLIRQLYSLKDQVGKIIIIDNGSNNIAHLKKNLIEDTELKGKFLLVELKENMGLGFAQNKGINVAKASNSSHILLLDQDSVLAFDFVNNMRVAEDQLQQLDSKVGAIGPVYFNEKTGEVYPITKYVGPFIKRLTPTIRATEATFLIASGCFINIEVIAEVGYMDEGLFIDYIDVEWCFRAKGKGYKLYANPLVTMSHTVGDRRASVLGRSISVHSPLRRYYLFRNSIHMVRDQSIDVGYKIREVSFNLLRFITFLFLAQEKMRYFKYSVLGLLDGFKGKVGKCPYNF